MVIALQVGSLSRGLGADSATGAAMVLAMPRSPFAQSPGGMLNRTWVSPSALSR